MRVVEVTRPGGPEVLRLAERPIPEPRPGEVLLRVVAASVNRPDIQQRRGLYPPPPDATDILGLDAAGYVEAVGSLVEDLKVGDAVCALTNGGAYADFCVVPAVQCMPLPSGFDFVQAASLPEAFFTAWNNVIWLGRLGEGETLLVQGGTSGVGMAAMQIARHLRNARVFATAGSPRKRDFCRQLGAEAAVDYRAEWDAELRAALDGGGFDVILDAQAGPYTQKQLDLLGEDGRLVLIASHLGEWSDVNVRKIVRRRLTLTGSTLRPRSPQYKQRLAKELVREVWPLLSSRRITSQIYEVVPFEDVARAHAILDENEQIGKVVLALDPAEASRRPN